MPGRWLFSCLRNQTDGLPKNEMTIRRPFSPTEIKTGFCEMEINQVHRRGEADQHAGHLPRENEEENLDDSEMKFVSGDRAEISIRISI